LAGIVPQFQVNEGAGVAAAIVRSTNDSNGANLSFQKTRGTTGSSFTAVQNGDTLGSVVWGGTDGTVLRSPAKIAGIVNGAVSGGNVPIDLYFSTGATDPGVERMRISSTGNVGIGTASPSSMLEVSGGAIVSDGQSSSAQCVNFGTGNMQVSSYSSSNTINIGGLKDGGAYSLVLTGYTAGQLVTINGFTDSGCSSGISGGVDFGGSNSSVTNTFTAVGNTQVVTFLYSANRGIAYASASTNFYH